MFNEEWKSISGYEGIYEISNHGRCRRIKKYLRSVPYYLSPIKQGSGYITYGLSVNNKLEQKQASRLVATAFLGPIPNGLHINHIDSNPLNNHIDNLEIVTPSQNIIHSWMSGNGRGKIKPEWISKIFEMKKYGMSNSKIGDQFGIKKSTIQGLTSGRTWKFAYNQK